MVVTFRFHLTRMPHAKHQRRKNRYVYEITQKLWSRNSH